MMDQSSSYNQSIGGRLAGSLSNYNGATMTKSPETKSPEQQLEDIKANLEQAAIDAYLNRDLDTMKKIGWLLEIIIHLLKEKHTNNGATK